MEHARNDHRVLFIEDDPDIIERIHSSFLQSAPEAHLEFVTTPEEGLESVRHEPPDIVFIEERIGGSDSAAFLRGLEAQGSPIPVIVLSQHADEEAVVKALRDGAADLIAAGPDSVGTYPSLVRRTVVRREIAREHADLAAIITRSKKQWVSIIDAITDFIFVIDSSQTIVKVNNAFAIAIGSHPRILVGRKIGDVFNLDIPKEDFLRELTRDGLSRTYEKKIGDEIYQISIFPLQEDDRALTIHVMKNVTEVRRLKDQLYHADKLASIGQLVSGVAHEINNPLTGTIAYTELLSMKVADEQVKRELKKILDSAERCKKIVDNLLTFSRQRTPSKSLESMSDIIDRAIDLRSYWLRSNSIQITRDYDPSSTVFVDAQQIQQVMLNLLLNAEQAIIGTGQTGGRIIFTTHADKANKRVIVTVADNGPGIPAKIASRVFDPFYTTKPVGIGTGLGLSIAHGIITEHGGTIGLAAGEVGGATFRIELPTGTGALPKAPILTESQHVK